MASILLVVALVFLLRKRACTGNGGHPVLSTIWVRKPENGVNNSVANGKNGNKTNGFVSEETKGTPATMIANGNGQVNHSNGVIVNGTAYCKEDSHAYEIEAVQNPDIVPNGGAQAMQLVPNSPFASRSHEDFNKRFGALATLRRNSNTSERGTPEGDYNHPRHHELHGYQNALCSPALLRKTASSSPVHDVRKIIRPMVSDQHLSPNVMPRSNLLNQQLGSDALYPHPGGYNSSNSAYSLRDQWDGGYGAGYGGANYSTLGYGRESSPSPRVRANKQHVPASQTLPRLPNATSSSPGHYANTQQLYSPYYQGGSPSVAAGIASPTPVREFGYPSDYGLPLEPLPEDNGELLASPHEPSTANLAMNSLNDMYFNPETGSDIMEPIHPHPLPHQQHLMHQQQQLNLSNSSADSSTLSPMRTSAGLTMSSGIGDASTASGML